MNDCYAREQAQQHRRLVEICQAILDKRLGIIEGSNCVTGFAHLSAEADPWEDEDFSLFKLINSATDHIPLGLARHHLADHVRPAKDQELQQAEDFYRAQVWESCRWLMRRFQPEWRLVEICRAMLHRQVDLIKVLPIVNRYRWRTLAERLSCHSDCALG